MKTTDNYSSYKDVELVKLLRERNCVVPYTDEGRVMKHEAIRVLMEQDANAANMKQKARVIFHNSSSPSAGPYVFASVNDRNFQAPFEKEVIIPAYFLRECIDRARTKKYVYKENGHGGFDTEVMYIPTYPYTFLGFVDDATEETAATVAII